jgi:hypothetical protein
MSCARYDVHHVSSWKIACLQAKIRTNVSQFPRVAQYNLLHGAPYSEIRIFACVFVRILESCMSCGTLGGDSHNTFECTTYISRPLG